MVPHLHAGQTLGEGQTLKFRLPVDAAATQLASIVYHGDAQFGIYPVQTYDNEKFIEVESADFSPYSYELLDGETTNPIAAIGTTGYATLAEAVAAVPTDGTETTITMLAGETIAADAGVTIAAGKNIVLDCQMLEYISSSGLRLFLGLLKNAKTKGSTVTVTNLSDDLRRVFDEIGFTQLFNIK